MSETASLSQSAANELIGSYFLRLWQYSKTPEPESDEEEESPTALDIVISSGGFVVVSADKLTISYPNSERHEHDVGVVKANRPAPSKRLVYYFEMKVKNAGAKGKCAIGFTTSDFKVRRQPGWEPNTWGYHGDDGLLYRGNGKGETFGPTYHTGDTVGGGINYATQEFFFTKNGELINSVYEDIKVPVYPTVSVHSENEEVTVNFGKEKFLFDLNRYEAEQRKNQQKEIDNTSLSQDASYGIVQSYLQHYGYEETLNLMNIAGGSTIPPIYPVPENGSNVVESMYDLNQRSTLRQLIRRGEIDEAVSKLHQWYPKIVEDDTSAFRFLLHSQEFIELVRVKRLEDAVQYGRNEFVKFQMLPFFDDFVKDCAALLAYEEPSKSSVGYLLEDSQRELLADAVNAVILSTNPNINDATYCTQSRLERLVRQLALCFLEKRSLNANQGEAFHLHRILKSGKKD